MSASDAQRMMKLFAGYMEAHGTHGKTETRPGAVKKEIKRSAKTVREPITEEVWQQHLDGERALGIMNIDEDFNSFWGCLDIDDYAGLNHSYIAGVCEKHNFPVVVCRSKSGGAHVFLFVQPAVPAASMREKISKMALILGKTDSEIFPKQTQVLFDKGDLGSWLNMPYYASRNTDRFCITTDQRQLSLSEFLDYAEKRVIDYDDFADVGSEAQFDPIEDLEEGPPCVRILATQGFPPGTRNGGLFALGTLAKKKFPEEWEAKVEDWNRRFMDPPLDSGEVHSVKTSLKRKDYHYRCGDEPIKSYCDKQSCRRMKYGVGGGTAAAVISTISVLDSEPKLFFVTLDMDNAKRNVVECDSATLSNFRYFSIAALEQCLITMPPCKQEDWTNQVNRMMAKANIIDAPPEISTTGVFLEHMEKFCTDKHSAQVREEILLGKVWYDEQTNRYWFRLKDFMDHLQRKKFETYTRPQVSMKIKAEGGGRDFLNLHGKGVNVWWVPGTLFSIQLEPHQLPQIQEIPI